MAKIDSVYRPDTSAGHNVATMRFDTIGASLGQNAIDTAAVIEKIVTDGTLATVTHAYHQNFFSGSTVRISDIATADLNGTHDIMRVSATQFTFVSAVAAGEHLAATGKIAYADYNAANYDAWAVRRH